MSCDVDIKIRFKYVRQIKVNGSLSRFRRQQQSIDNKNTEYEKPMIDSILSIKLNNDSGNSENSKEDNEDFIPQKAFIIESPRSNSTVKEDPNNDYMSESNIRI